MDNALVIHDYNGFNIWIMGEKETTNVPANDGKWHHMAFTWQSSSGAWKVYKDGSNVKQSTTAFQAGQVSTIGYCASAVISFQESLVTCNLWTDNENAIG